MNHFELLLPQVLELLIFSKILLLLHTLKTLHFFLYFLRNYGLLLLNLLLILTLLLFLVWLLQVSLIYYRLLNLRKIIIHELLVSEIAFVSLLLLVHKFSAFGMVISPLKVLILPHQRDEEPSTVLIMR
jgi:hypothetical protein